MIRKFRGINLSSKSPEAMARFYNEKLEIPILDKNDNDYDGVELGYDINEPHIWIWDENSWGKSTTGIVTLVFECDNHEKTYEELKQRGVVLAPPKVAVWGGKELHVKDPDGNIVLIL